ncbi:MAG: nuclear transport factor 2 family protein [Acidobacteria bacterium]|nr:nuclear transport factor 2 family protein [Acidobacteriota bacterium]
MKIFFLAAIAVFFTSGVVFAQKQDTVEQKIRALDIAEAEAILAGDVATLEEMWAKDILINNPRNAITKGRSDLVGLVRSGNISYSSFVREIEAVEIHGNVVIVMGLETVKPKGKAPRAGQTVRRRYSHFWMQRDGKWLLTARHSNIICQN